MNDQMENILKRLNDIEVMLGINAIKPNNSTKLKAIIKRGSNDFNNGIKLNPFIIDTQEYEWWEFGYKYAQELDAE